MKPSTLSATDPLSDLRAALKRYDESNSAAISFKPTLSRAWAEFDSLLRYPRGHCGSLADCLAKNEAHGVPASGDRASFNAALAAAREAEAKNGDLQRAAGEALAGLESAVASKVSTLIKNISRRKAAIIEEVKGTLTPHCEYPGDAMRITTELYGVRVLATRLNNLAKGNAVSQARTVISLWSQYAEGAE